MRKFAIVGHYAWAGGLTLGVVTALAIFGVQPAAAVTCDPSYASNVVSSSGCELGSTNNDNPLPGQVNADNMFSESAWEFLSKTEQAAPWKSGTWDLGALFWDAYAQAMLVFKGGDGNCVPCVYVGYLLLPADGTSGTWTTPFHNENNGKEKDVSHISLYAVKGPSEVPLPAALPLFGSALVGAGLIGWRKRRKAA